MVFLRTRSWWRAFTRRRSVSAESIDAPARPQKYSGSVLLRPFDELIGDLRYGLRGLRKHAGFSVVAVLSLALGIGATTSMFSLIYAVLLHPVPYANWQRIVFPMFLNDERPDAGGQWFILNWSQYQLLQKANAVEDVVGDDNERGVITGRDLPEEVTLTYITENVGQSLAVPALLGRNLLPSDAASSGQQAPVVLSYSFWLRRYSSDRNVLGKVLEVEHKPYVVVGVMPKDYTWEPDMYVPMSLLPTRERNVLPIMRLKQGVSLFAADSEIDALLQQFAKEAPQEWPKKFRVHLEHITDRVLEQAGHALGLLFAAVVMLLIIGCANCSILLLARGMERQSEFALRVALGASCFRIVRQLLVEASVLALSGSLLGIGFAYWMAKLIFGLFPDVFMHESSIRINLPVLAFSTALAILSGLIFSLLPALRMSRPDVSQIVQRTGRKMAGRVGQAGSLNALIAAQIALTVVIMGAAGAAIGGFMKLTHRSFGYEPSHAMAVGIPLHRNHWTERTKRLAYLESLRQKVAGVPGVTQVAIANGAVPPDTGLAIPFEVLGMPMTPQRIRVSLVDPGYFSTLRIPLLRGRLWNETENSNGAAVVIINQTLAHRYFPKGNAIGQQLRFPRLKIVPRDDSDAVGVPDTDGWMQVIGVAGDSLNDGLDKPIQPAIYMPYTRVMEGFTVMLVRTQGQPLAALHSIRAAIQSVNPDQEITNDSGGLEQLLEQQPEFQQQRLFSILFGLFSGLALVLALVGLYSVVSYSVAQRTNSFGIRMALGAQRSHILWIVVRSVGATVGCGLGAGLIFYASLQRVLMHWTQSSYSSPMVLVTVAVLFALSAGVACLFPALRAASIEPMQALRYE